MVTIGDSFSVVAILAGLAVTAWSFLIVCALLLPAKVDAARNAVAQSAGKSFGAGLLSLLLLLATVIILSVPNPGLKLLGTVMLAGYFGLIAVGISGVCKLAAERLRALAGTDMSVFTSFGKASAYVVTAAMLPLLGWFLFAPMLLILGAGAGLRAAMTSTQVSSAEVV